MKGKSEPTKAQYECLLHLGMFEHASGFGGPGQVCEVIGFMHEHPSLAEACLWSSPSSETIKSASSTEAVKRHQLAFDLYLATTLKYPAASDG